jgi:hypothetical protein
MKGRGSLGNRRGQKAEEQILNGQPARGGGGRGDLKAPTNRPCQEPWQGAPEAELDTYIHIQSKKLQANSEQGMIKEQLRTN